MAKIIHVGTDVQMHLAVLTDTDDLMPPQRFDFTLHKLADESFDQLKGLMRQSFAAQLAQIAAIETKASADSSDTSETSNVSTDSKVEPSAGDSEKNSSSELDA